jgi:hypothetical protein
MRWLKLAQDVTRAALMAVLGVIVYSESLPVARKR